MENKSYRGHVLLIPFPAQGHINPILQFSKRLSSKGVRATLAITRFVAKSLNAQSFSSIHVDTISDGCDDGGYAQASSVEKYAQLLETVGSDTLAELIIKHKHSAHPINCVVYDTALPWALVVAKQLGLLAAPFFTQMCAVDYIYYNVHHGLLRLPISSTPVSIPGLPLLQHEDLPSFLCSAEGSYAVFLETCLNQFMNVEKADCILVNTFYALEQKVVDSMSKVCPLLTVGPTIPSTYMDKSIHDDKSYGLNLFTLDASACINWLNSKPPGSVVYVSFGSVACLSKKQMVEVAWGLKQSNHYFLWVVRSTEEEKLSKEFRDDTDEKGLIVSWSPQLEVLSNKAVGSFVTHSGWNSTTEALSMGVPMVAIPQWTDQTTCAKFVDDIWKVGIRAKADDGDGIVSREQIESCIRQVMEGERGKEMKENAKKWRDLAIKAVNKGGSSDKNVDEFISKLTNNYLSDNDI